MSEASKAYLKNVRIAPRKARLVADMVRGKAVQTALDTLKLTNRKAAPIISKMISSAIANATDKSTVDVDRLVISELFVDEGTTLKRWLPRAQGRATPLRKRSSHITLKLKEL
jgi:large subunit ribosomal protein L22